MNYKFDIFNNGENQFLIIVFEGIRNGKILSGLFDIDEEYGYWLDIVDKVLSGESCYEELGVEGFSVDVYSDRTKVEFEFEENIEVASVEISTDIFREILVEWIEEVKKFNERNNKE